MEQPHDLYRGAVVGKLHPPLFQGIDAELAVEGFPSALVGLQARDDQPDRLDGLIARTTYRFGQWIVRSGTCSAAARSS